MNWISVKDRLPDKYQVVLLLIDGLAIEGTFDPLSKEEWNRVNVVVLHSHGCGCCGSQDPDPTHWMPLPEPPKE